MALAHYAMVQNYVKAAMAMGMYSFQRNRRNMVDREGEVRATISVEKAISQIEKFGGVYDPFNTNFDVYNQLLACESITESTPYALSSKVTETSGDAIAYGGGNDARKRTVNFELTPNKLEAVSKLKTFNYKTPPPEIASQLETVFIGFNTEFGWWLSVAQQWNPRAINRVIVQLVKLHTGGWRTINNPAAYFTSLIKYRKKRRRPQLSMMVVNKK